MLVLKSFFAFTKLLGPSSSEGDIRVLLYLYAFYSAIGSMHCKKRLVIFIIFGQGEFG
jgi:hypothetical protein